MNAANHGQCHRRRNSRDERPAEARDAPNRITAEGAPAGEGKASQCSPSAAATAVEGGGGIVSPHAAAVATGGGLKASLSPRAAPSAVRCGVDASETTDSEPSPSSEQSLQGEDSRLHLQQFTLTGGQEGEAEEEDPPVVVVMRNAVVSSQRPSSYPKPPRGRSGSWSGVNESEDGL